jgi:CCR4-NOT transcriptional regulation complex NOT5 subunit
MSAAQIIAELPNLSAEERKAVARRLRELEEQDGLQFLHKAVDQMFQSMDQAEAKNARSKTR